MKICLINNLFTPFSRGGAERIVEITAEEFKRLGHDVFVITTRPQGRKPPKGTGKKIKVYYLPSFYINSQKIHKFFRLFFHILSFVNILAFLKVKRILKKEKCDLVITHNLLGLSFLIPFAIRLNNIRHVHTMHDIQLLHPSGLMIFGLEGLINTVQAKIYQCLTRFVFRSAQLVISPSNWLLKLHTERLFFSTIKKRKIRNPIIVKEGNKKNTSNKYFTILYVGQIEEHKGVKFMLEALEPFLKDHSPRVRLRIVGEGRILPFLRQKKYNNVEFLGRLNNNKVNIAMRESDLLLLPSLCYENSPTVIYEALSNNIPVLASRLGGITELIEDYGGLLFKPGNKESLRASVANLIKNPTIINSGNFQNNFITPLKYCEYILE